MRTKVTRKQITENYCCIALNYYQLQHLLSYADSPYYTEGIYGWNFDVYPFEFKGRNIAICTGYHNMPGKHIAYDVEHEFDVRAEKICYDNKGNKKERLDTLIQEFLAVAFPEL